MRWVSRLLAAAVVLTAGMGQAQQAPKRVALVIANAGYAGYPALPNAATDAGLVRETLARAGFGSVEVQSDVGVAAFRGALARFASAAASADVALVYYAGHAVEVAGRNWLIPRDAALASDADLPAQGVDAVDVFTAMAGAKTRIVVLDACRENPFEARLRSAGTRGVGRGLGAPTAASGLADLTRAGDSAQGALLMYSAAPGRVAEDGVAGQGSPFARAFAKHFAEPDLDLRFVVGKISDAVAAETNNRQLPFSTLSLSGVPIVFLRNEDRQPPPVPTAPGTEFRDCAECPLMVVVPAGEFLMGSPQSEAKRDEHEGPQRRVTIVRPFAVSKFEVTFAEWDYCLAAGGCRSTDGTGAPFRPSDAGKGRGNRPVENVNWHDAKSYVRWLNAKVGGRAYRLLTEAEWEYAARAGTTTAFSTGPMIGPTQAKYRYDMSYAGSPRLPRIGPVAAVPVGSFPANSFGLHDMHGNQREWIEDCQVRGGYAAAANDGSAAVEAHCTWRGLRGGAYYSEPQHLRSASRDFMPAEARASGQGIRVARNVAG